MSTLKNIITQALKPGRFVVMDEKVIRRLERPDQEKNLRWLGAHAEDYSAVFSAWDPVIWDEAVRASERINAEAGKKLERIEFDLGGGGAVPFLYFLVRKLAARTVLETGVAAGYSSAAILSAIKANGFGKLFSSDFPYFRLQDPEKYIGFVVDDYLKAGWDLHIEGDRKNIPAIMRSIESIDVFHYDSDKSYAGRSWAIEQVRGKLHSRSMIVWDDIQDNCHFMDFVAHLPRDSWWVFHYDGKYVGMLRWAAVAATVSTE